MNKFYSMQMEPENGTKVRESFKFVLEEKRDVWKDNREDLSEQSEPSCCLSVSKISYTVR